MKKLRFFIVMAIVITASSIFIFNALNDKNNARKDHVEFLKSKYEKLAGIDANNANELPKFDRPDIAAMQDFLMTFDPETKTIPKKRLIKAYEHMQAKKAVLKNDPIEWTNIPVEMGGRTRALMFDPNDASNSKVWAGSVTGGLWYNENIADESSTWVAIDDFMDNLSTSVITYDPNDTETFYVGTGESETAIITYRESSGKGVGIWKSEDAGATWNLIPSTVDFEYISDIVVRDEAGSSVIYAAVVSGIYMGSQHNSQPTDGLYRSTDGGTTWEQVLPDIVGSDAPYAPADIELGADNRMYIGTQNNLNNEGGAVILYSDAGTSGTWTVFDDYNTIIQNDPNYDIPGRIMLAAAPSDANRVYALVSSGYTSSNNGFNYFYCNYILRTDNKGVNWAEKSLPSDPSSGSNFATIAWHALVGEVNPSNPNELWVGGLDVFKTTNGADSWVPRLSDWWDMYYGGGPRYVHADIHEIVYNPGDDNNLIIGTDGGVFYTTNSTNTEPVFEERNYNYNTLQFYTGDIIDAAGQDLLVGGLQDNGTLLYNGDPISINNMVSGGDGAFCFFDDNDPSGILITSVYYNSYYFYWNSGSNSNAHDEGNGIFINPADYDSETNTLYCNSMMFNGSYQDQILRITGIPDNVSAQNINIGSGATTVFSNVKVSPHSASGTTLFLGTQAGRMFKVTNAQATPSVTEITGSSFPPANISSIDVGGSEDTLIVTFSNYGVPSIFQSYDGGASWQLKEGDLPDMPVRWVIYHPNDAKKALIATELGIWYCDHLDQTNVMWQPATTGLANVRVDMLQLRKTDNMVLAATHGRGLFTAPFGNPPSLLANFEANETSIVEGNTIDYTDLSFGSPVSWEWTFEGANPASSLDQSPSNILYENQGSYDVTLTISDGTNNHSITKEDYITVSPEGIVSVNNLDEVQLFPNPTSDFVEVNNTVGLLSYEVYNSSGQLLNKSNSIGSKSLKIDLRKYNEGIYYIKLNTKSKTITKRVLKQ